MQFARCADPPKLLDIRVRVDFPCHFSQKLEPLPIVNAFGDDFDNASGGVFDDAFGDAFFRGATGPYVGAEQFVAVLGVALDIHE